MRALVPLAVACAHAPVVEPAVVGVVAPATEPITVDGAGWDAVCADGVAGPRLRPLPLGAALFLCGDDRGRVVVLWPDGEIAATVDTALAEPSADGWSPLVEVRPHPVALDAAWAEVPCGDLTDGARLHVRTSPPASAWHVPAAAAVATVRRGGACLQRVVASCPPVEPPPPPGPTLRCGAATLSFARQGGRTIVVHEDDRGVATLDDAGP